MSLQTALGEEGKGDEHNDRIDSFVAERPRLRNEDTVNGFLHQCLCLKLIFLKVGFQDFSVRDQVFQLGYRLRGAVEELVV